MQSRSPRCTTAPWSSAAICTSTWRARGDEALDVDASSPNAAPRLAAGHGEQSRELVRVARELDPAAAAAAGRLEQERVAVSVATSSASELTSRGRAATGTPAAAAALARAQLVAGQLITSAGGPTNAIPFSSARVGEPGFSERKP